MSTHAIFRPPAPSNEPIFGYAPGSPERRRLQRRLDEMKNGSFEGAGGRKIAWVLIG